MKPETKALADRMIEAVKSFVARALDARVVVLEARIAALESSSLKYLGVWREGSYIAGSAVTDHGSLWVAAETTTDRPGTSERWQLAVKKGRADR